MKLNDKNIIIFAFISFFVITFIIFYYCKCNNSDLSEELSYDNNKTDNYINKSSTEIYSEDTTEVSPYNNNLSISLVKMDHSIKSENNAVVAYLYYDKPVLTGDTEAINKINNFLENEYDGWLNGSNRLTYYYDGIAKKFLETVEEFRAIQGDEYFSKYPFKYFISYEIMHVNNDILSIKQTQYYQTAGPSYTSYFGTTFDLNTGEVIPLDKLIDINADDFRNKILSYVMENVVEKYYKNSYDEAYETNYKIYAPNENHDFKLGYGGEPYELNYDYYYDGEYYYIILRDVAPINYEIILKWSGNMEDEFEGVYNYLLKKDNTFKLIKDE